MMVNMIEAIIYDIDGMLGYLGPSYKDHQWPLLLTWFNFNPSMDK